MTAQRENEEARVDVPRAVRIGGASGFWGDSQIAVPQLLCVPDLDYLVFDYLAETTMALLQRARARDESRGYATDFVTTIVKEFLPSAMQNGVRLLSNAGGLNPAACRAAILKVAAAMGLHPRVVIVTGDDVLHLQQDFVPFSDGDRTSPAVNPALLSANAYLGAVPVARALALGADIVLTGRGVDSALVLGIAMHEFGWKTDDYDLLAQGSLAGHLIECGPQVTGGLFTDWQSVPDWAAIGYPVVAIRSDGEFEITKPHGTGGLVTPDTVAEQLLYEIGDPSAYELPDVICDFRAVTISRSGPQRVAVRGARGREPSGNYKVSATFHDGYQINLMMLIRGLDARAKAERTAAELLSRTRSLMRLGGFDDYTDSVVELLGTEAMYGANARAFESREIVLRLAARHTNAKALACIQKESASVGTSFGPGTRGHIGGRASVQDVVRLRSYFLVKSAVEIRIEADDLVEVVSPARRSGNSDGARQATANPTLFGNTTAKAVGGPYAAEDMVVVPLVKLAMARSGDKGDDANIGVVARCPELLPLLRSALSADRVAEYFKHLVHGPVSRYELPGINAFNFLLERALGGGGTSSLRSDPLGKSYAQMLLDIQIDCPRQLLTILGTHTSHALAE